MFRLALAQSPANLAGQTARLDWLDRMLPGVTGRNADLLLLPELFACGYNIGDALVQSAEPADGPTYLKIAALARDYSIAIHYSYAERDGGQIYNSAACIGPDGQVLGRHRKLAIPPGFERKYFTAGQGCEVFTYKGLKIATLICYDVEFCETVRHVASMGAQLVLVPTALSADWGWVAQTMIPSRAYENGVYLAYANSAGTENDMAFLGQSVIAAPNGTEAARAGTAPEVLFADLDPSLVAKAQACLPYLAERHALNLT